MFSQFEIRRALRYGAVGIAQNGFSYLLILLMLRQGWAAWQAFLILNPIIVVLTFLIHRYWTFEGRVRRTWQPARYGIVYGSTYFFAVAFTWLQEAIGVQSWLASLITIGVAACGLFLVLNRWVFGQSSSGNNDA